MRADRHIPSVHCCASQGKGIDRETIRRVNDDENAQEMKQRGGKNENERPCGEGREIVSRNKALRLSPKCIAFHPSVHRA
jgi:hypothetical protein